MWSLPRSRWLLCATLAAAVWGAGPLRAGEGDDAGSPPPAAGGFDREVKPLLGAYCVGCHGPAKQKGDRRFDRLDGAIRDDDTLVDLQDILDQLNLGEMPPKEARQPSQAERRRAVAWLTARIAQFQGERRPADVETVLRRLNAREYRNTLRDLLHLNMTMFDPTAGFPRDQTTEHLDNVGETLVTSGPLLQRYLAAARQATDKVFVPARKPPVQTWTFRGDFRQGLGIDGVHKRTNGLKHMTLYEVVGSDKIESAYAPILAFQDGVPYDGTYEIRFQAESVNRRHPYDPDFVGIDRDRPFRVGIVPGNIQVGPLHAPQPIEPLLAEVELTDEPRWYTVRVWLDAGHTPRFTFRNGMMDVRKKWTPLVKQYADEFPAPVRGGIAEARLYAIQHGKLPQVRVHQVEISGPFLESWPTAGQRAVLGDDWEAASEGGEIPEETLRRHLAEFTARAYRRPARDEEVERLMRLIALRRGSGRSPLEAYEDGLRAVLCSPGFLYLDEPGETQLSPHALASRLSYFLWSSMPDRPLLDLAASGGLLEPDVLAEQARRMLEDPRSDGFVDGFLESWLALRDLGSMPPDRVKFGDYYRHDLQASMREETRLFTRHLLDDNLSLANFLDSDFTFVDEPLARHYGLTPPAGRGFARVTLNDRRRGGLLGMASVLTVTANGIDTSPVVRGIWLLENILGTPPAPPPPDVEPLDPDVRGATTIREQLEKHRRVATCYECHRKIDPPGFALENFDAIGAWRDRYEAAGDGTARPVDPAGELPDGRAFADVAGLKALLGTRVDQFAHCLTEKLLTYALGRTLSASDRPEVSRIVAEAKARGYGLKDLLLLVARSRAFRSR
jgi:mono/diheme cytochrome c family protein